MESSLVSVLRSKCKYRHSQQQGRVELIALIPDSENSVFSNVTNPVFTDQGYACLVGNDLGGATDAAPQGTCFKPPYNYQLDATSDVKSIVTKGAGANLSFY
jgi:hypothetical protein